VDDPAVDAAFLRTSIRPSTLDRALQRRAVLEHLHEIAPTLAGTVLDVGCGHQPYRSLVERSGASYVGLDLPPTRYRSPGLVWDGTSMPARARSVDAVLATELLEHVPDPTPLLREVRRVLKPGGRMHFTVPYLWPLHDVPDDQYRYTPFALERVLRTAGFVDVEIRATGGWDASLAQLIGLWARRRPMSSRWRRPVSIALTPIVWALARVDAKPERFAESTMLTGLAGSATSSAPSSARGRRRRARR
jgi:SAM-dependent methyltransferase